MFVHLSFIFTCIGRQQIVRCFEFVYNWLCQGLVTKSCSLQLEKRVWPYWNLRKNDVRSECVEMSSTVSVNCIYFASILHAFAFINCRIPIVVLFLPFCEKFYSTVLIIAIQFHQSLCTSHTDHCAY